MIWRTALQYTQFWLILALASSQLTNDQKERIVELHNQYRALVNPQAANMQRMLWDDVISQVAVNFSSRCIWENNLKIKGVLGENLFLTLGSLIIDQPINLWHNENVNYNYNTNTCSNGKQCGHYTQMVWANSSFIGCAAQFCPTFSNFDGQNGTILVCNYYPPGNILGKSPYIDGPACSACLPGTIACLNNTCDRGSNINSGFTAAIGNSAGFTKPSAVTLLLVGLTAIYIQMT